MKDAEGNGVENARVTIKAVGSGNEPVYSDGGNTLVKEVTKHTAATTGLATFTLTANASLIPSDSYYRVSIKAPSERKERVFNVQIPAVGSSFDVEDVLHDPGTVETSALAAHKLSVADHADVDLTGNATGKVLMYDGTNFVPASTHATDLEVASAVLVETNARIQGDADTLAAAATDATTKANAAEADAIAYTDAQAVKLTGTQTVAGAKTFSDEATFLGDVGFGEAPGGFDFKVKANARFIQKGAGESAVIIQRAFDPGDPEYSASDVLLMGMNSDYTDEQWRFDAEGNFKVVDIDGDNIVTLKRDDDSVHVQVTRSIASGNAYICAVNGESANRFVIQANGVQLFGTGSAAPDVTFSRTGTATIGSSNHLGCGQDMFVGRQLIVGSTTGGVSDSVNLIAGSGRGGRMLLSDVLTDATTKIMRIGVPHQTNAEEPMFAFFAQSTSAANTIGIGGGSSLGNAATVIDFYTAADTITTTGTKRLTIDSSGRIGVNQVPSGNYMMRIVPTNAAYAVLTARQITSQVGSLFTVEDTSNAILSRFNKDGFFMTRKTSAPADGDLATGELALWFDSTAGAAKAMFKGKNASGSIVTASVALA